MAKKHKPKSSPMFNPLFAKPKKKKQIDLDRLIKQKRDLEGKLLNETTERRRLSLEVQIEKIEKKLNSQDTTPTTRKKKHEDQKHGKVKSISVSEYLAQKNNSDSETSVVEELVQANIKDKSFSDESVYQPLTRQEVNHALLTYSISELLRLWDSRLELIPDQTSGAKVLSILRFKQGIDKTKKGYQSYLNHESVLDLPEDETTLKTESIEGLELDGEASELNITDSKKSGLVKQTIREGQSSFRTNLISHYGASCMITGDRIEEIIEAAHILPYSGKESNHISNGLLLRVDLHRLFDKNLLGIDIDSMTIKLSEQLRGTSYWALNSCPLKVTNPIFNKTLLRERWKQFRSST